MARGPVGTGGVSCKSTELKRYNTGGPKYRVAHWCHLAGTTEWSVRGRGIYAAVCLITFTTCFTGESARPAALTLELCSEHDGRQCYPSAGRSLALTCLLALASLGQN